MPTYHLLFDDGRWILKQEGQETPSAEFTTLAEALLHADRVQEVRPFKLVIYNEEGDINEERVYGNSEAPQEWESPGADRSLNDGLRPALDDDILNDKPPTIPGQEFPGFDDEQEPVPPGIDRTP